MIVLIPFSYFFVILSAPVYLLMRRRGWVSLWQLLAAGAVFGVLVCVVLGPSSTTVRSATLYGGVGILTALGFWLVAFVGLRPNTSFERTREG
jgi:hypothetical protein